MTRQKAIYQDIYKRTVGHLSDREMLELEVKINPGRRMIIDAAIGKDEK